MNANYDLLWKKLLLSDGLGRVIVRNNFVKKFALRNIHNVYVN